MPQTVKRFFWIFPFRISRTEGIYTLISHRRHGQTLNCMCCRVRAEGAFGSIVRFLRVIVLLHGRHVWF